MSLKETKLQLRFLSMAHGVCFQKTALSLTHTARKTLLLSSSHLTGLIVKEKT